MEYGRKARWRHLALNGNDLVWNRDHLAIEPCFEVEERLPGGDEGSNGVFYLVYPEMVSISGASQTRKGTIQDFDWFGEQWYDFTAVFSNVKNVNYSHKGDWFIRGYGKTKVDFSVSFTYEETVTSVRRRDKETTVSKVEKRGEVSYVSNEFNPYDGESLSWTLKRRYPEDSSFDISSLPQVRFVDEGGEGGEDGDVEIYKAVDDDDNY